MPQRIQRQDAKAQRGGAATQTDLTTEDTECSRRRNGSFFISVSSVSSVVNSQLDDDKQVVLDWDQFSGFVVRD